MEIGSELAECMKKRDSSEITLEEYQAKRIAPLSRLAEISAA
jgi:hypothetical protein